MLHSRHGTVCWDNEHIAFRYNPLYKNMKGWIVTELWIVEGWKFVTSHYEISGNFKL